ncbi:ChrR-like anti-ECFsigma factor [Candidatus Pelagibacter ubique]|jgi:anti-sigma factor ChrR (cupin superfamily)|uniref:ChrR-like anti-ECFsigma factor n=1 Tax=Pelagibacter ubique TaxID=198252 RepID=A0ABX1T127_PELUQ|nr:cupin domain-containing protein [Candidatus Pelagibacter ubique]NMN66905.1 ChrR-like anti-ECFsigma factor [Candidatus Pelagibacter ubique]|tara:strand:- start:1629 stop:1976 length:348 start_codon:yes stop_codon:yes gene_type:complete
MTKRKITNPYDVEFIPFDNYGAVVPGMSWYKISYNKEKGGQGTYVLKMEPGARSLPHKHTGFEEFFMLDGELIDPDGKIFKKGDFISFEPESEHSSHTINGCLVLVFMRGINQPL